jgi:hypothetical protein
MIMDYNLYLFSNLVKLYDKEFEELPYDEQFDRLPTMYDDFHDSKFNVYSKSEYDCIIDYLNYKYKIIYDILGNRVYEITKIIHDYNENKYDILGNRVYEITKIIHDYNENKLTN